MVELGQIITAIEGNEKYRVDALWVPGASTVIDFTAKRLRPAGVGVDGELIYPGRGFSYANKNWV